MRRSNKQNQRRKTIKRIVAMRGGNVNTKLETIVRKFELVKHSYREVYDKVFDDVSDFKEAIEDCCLFEVTVPKNSFFIGKLDNGSTAVIVSKSADRELRKKLEKIADSVVMYVLDDKLLLNLTEGWDHAGDTGYVSTNNLSIDGETKIGHIKYDLSFQLKGDYRQEYGRGSQNVRGSWEEGDGVIQLVAEFESEYYKRQKKMAPASLAAMSRLGLDRELADEVEEMRLKSSYGDVKRVQRLNVVESELYTPSGSLDDVLKLSDKNKEEIKEAQKEFDKAMDERDEEIRRQEELRRDMMDTNYGMEYYDRDYDYRDDDEYYGGKANKSRRITRKLKNNGMRSHRQRKMKSISRTKRHSVKPYGHRKTRRY